MSGAKVVPIGAHEDACAGCGLTMQCLSHDVDNPDPSGSSDIPVAPRVLRRGEHLFRSGQPFEAVFVVRSGAVKTYMISRSGEEQVVGFHLPGDLVGIEAIAAGEYTCSAMALDTCSFCSLPFEKLMRLCGRSRTVRRRFVVQLAHKVVTCENMLLTLGQKSAEQRLASFLVHLLRRQYERGFSPTDINLPMSRADIASYLALAVETVSRVLTRLQDAGVLAVQRNRVQVLDLDALGRTAEEKVNDLRAGARHASGY